MNKCENCKDPDGCPWLQGKKGVKKCQIWIEKKKEERILKMVLKSGREIDRCPRFEDLNYEKFKTKDDIEIFKAGIKAIQAIHTNVNHLFFISSRPGTGKTHCLLAYAMKMMCNGLHVHYITAWSLRKLWLEIETSTFDPINNEEINSLIDSKIMIIDDFCYEGISITGHFQRNLESLLTSSRKKVILASNIPIDAKGFLYKNEPWIMDRLNAAVQITWFGESYRQPKR